MPLRTFITSRITLSKILFLIFLALVIVSCSKSTEELKQESEKLFSQASDLYSRGYFQQSEKYFHRLLEIDLELKNSQRIPNIYIYIGLIKFNRGDFEGAKKYYTSAEIEFRKQFNKKGESLALNNLAGVQATLGMYDSSEITYKKVLSLSLLSADKEAEAIAHVNLASLYKEIYKTSEALKQYQKAFESYTVLDDYRGKVYVANRIGELHLHSGNQLAALESFEFAIGLNAKVNSDYLSSSIFNNIGLAYFHQKKFLLAFESFKTAIEKNRSAERDEYLEIILQINLGDAAFELNQYSKAREYYISALTVAELSYYKYLAPYVQLKVGKCDQKLSELFNDGSSNSSAEMYFNYALERFTESKNIEGQKSAISRLLNLYQNIGTSEKIFALLKLYNELNPYAPWRFKEWSYHIAKNFENDNSIDIIKAFFMKKDLNAAYKTLSIEKLSQLRRWFMKFNDFSFLNKEESGIVISLKNELHRIENYHELLIKELSLPTAQRDDNKIELLEDEIDNSDEKINELKNELKSKNGKKYSLLLDLTYNPLEATSSIDSKKIYIEIVPTEKELMIFLISKSGIEMSKQNITRDDFEFLSADLSRNFQAYSIQEFKKISGRLFSAVFGNIKKKISGYKNVNFILNDYSSNFYPHLLYSTDDEKYFCRMVNVSYSAGLFSDEKNNSSGSVVFSSEINLTKHNDELKSLNSAELDYQQFNKSSLEPDKVKNVFVFASLILNSNNPNSSYIELNPDTIIDIEGQLSLSKFMSIGSENSYISDNYSDELLGVRNFFSLYNLLKGKSVIFPLIKKEKESSKFFLYNYARGLKNNEREEAFYSTIKLMMENPKYSHQRFWGNYFFMSN